MASKTRVYLTCNKSVANMQKLTYSQQYYLKLKAKKAGMSVADYVKSPLYKTRGKKSIDSPGAIVEGCQQAKIVSFDRVMQLSDLFIDENMLRTNKTMLPVDTLFSHEGGIPVGTNIMCTGDPGVGKTTLLMHTLSSLQMNNSELKCLFISAEMSKIQVYKYMQRFPIFSNLETLFTSDYMNDNLKDVIEQLLKKGYDYILMDSIVEVLDSVKEDNGWSQSSAEKWLIDLCVKQNEANNDRKCYSTFMLIQQVTKAGVFVGSNKMKHITDAHLEIKRESDRDGGGTYLYFAKNRNGQAGVRFGFQLNSDGIYYGTLAQESEEENETFELENATRS